MLETEIKKLTAALEANTAALQSAAGAAPVAAAAPAAVATQPTAGAPAAPAAAAAPAAVAAAPAPAAAAPSFAEDMDTTAPLSAEELDAQLVMHFKRLGSDRTPIDKVMTEQFGVQSIKNLPAESRQALLDAVAQIPSV